MPRCARQKSSLGIYHIMIRGINKVDIFNDDMDRKVFMKYLLDFKKKYEIRILAYCLMSNHVHILIKDEHDLMSKAMQSISVKYSQYFNKRYERCGHLFQNRYKSEIVESLNYLVNVIDYIHLNPKKAGMVKRNWI